MTAAYIVERAAALGVTLEVGGGKRLRYHGPRAAVEAMLPDLRANVSAIVAVLRERESVPTASDAVAAAASLLRACRWEHEPAPCRFFIGSAGDAECRRCGGSWHVHFDPIAARLGSGAQ